jgi:hypothetical protein
LAARDAALFTARLAFTFFFARFAFALAMNELRCNR